LIGPYALDLTGMRAGDVVDVDGTFYGVHRLDVDETVNGRDRFTGQALYLATTVQLKLERAHWLATPGAIQPSSALALALRGRKTTINGQGYLVNLVSEQLVYLNSGKATGDGTPERIEITLTRNPYEDDPNVIKSATLKEISIVGGRLETVLTDVEFEVPRG
jgi:hypothetical protein